MLPNIVVEMLALLYCVWVVCDSYTELEIVYPDEVLRGFPSSLSLSLSLSPRCKFRNITMYWATTAFLHIIVNLRIINPYTVRSESRCALIEGVSQLKEP
jgi:hypothetical protein